MNKDEELEKLREENSQLKTELLLELSKKLDMINRKLDLIMSRT